MNNHSNICAYGTFLFKPLQLPKAEDLGAPNVTLCTFNPMSYNPTRLFLLGASPALSLLPHLPQHIHTYNSKNKLSELCISPRVYILKNLNYLSLVFLSLFWEIPLKTFKTLYSNQALINLLLYLHCALICTWSIILIFLSNYPTRKPHLKSTFRTWHCHFHPTLILCICLAFMITFLWYYLSQKYICF